MPTYTPNLNLPKPLGTEYHNRANYISLIDAIDANAASKGVLTPHLNEAMPHKFTKGGVTYKYGFSVNDAMDGLAFNYEVIQ